MGFEQKEFNSFVLENNVYGFFKEPIILKSGRKSQFYANWRTIVEDTYLTDKLADFVIDFVKSNSLSVDTFYGVPEGATKLGIITQYKFAKASQSFGKGSHVLAMGRAKPKDHGDPKDKFFVGAPTGKVLVIEDVTTTGGSLITTLDGLKESGITVVAVISLTNRMEKREDGKSVKDAIEEKGVKFYSMSSALDMLPLMYKKLSPGEEIKKAVEEEFKQFGTEELRL
ncbi:MAG: phosphoribosyltransferase family protein [archaeon]|jgi:orotate phosphoribosyltransferase